MKKRILALLLCCTLLLGLLPAAFTAAADADASFKVVDASGAAVSYVEVPQNGKFALTAQKSQSVPAGAYQWQISVPGTDGVWANILDAQGSTLELSYAMVANMLQSGLAYVRCRLTAGEQTLYTDAVSVAIGYAAIEQPARMISEVKPVVISEAQPIGQPILTPAQSAPAAAPAAPAAPADPAPAADPAPTADPAPSADPAPADEAPTTDEAPTPTEAPTEAPAADEVPAEGDTTESPATNDSGSTGTNDAPSTYNIVINYVFADGQQAAPSWTATVPAGTTYQQEITSPVVLGYTPDQETVKVNAPEKTTYTVTYNAALVKVTVKHYKQNVDNDKYTPEETETIERYTKDAVGGTLAKSYTGFTALLYDTTTEIAADGSTEVEVYYDRNYYLMNFNLDGGYGVEPIYGRYGAPISIGEPTRAGYTFAGWDKEIPETMPAENRTYTAQWQAGDAAKVTIVVWGENADDEEYSFYHNAEIMAKPGEKLTLNDLQGKLVCGKEEHTHSERCGITCGHTHSLTCYGLSASAGSTSPNSNTAWWCDSNPETYFAQLGVEDGYLYYDDENARYDSKDNYYLRFDGKYYTLTQSQFNKLKGTEVGKTSDNSSSNPDYYYKYSINASGMSCNHTHTDSCYACGKTEHTHTSACYFNASFMENPNLWKLVRSDEVTVAADGTTIINVYYDRVEFTLHFRSAYSNNDNYGTIKAKWGANIREQFNAKCTQAGTSNWSENRDSSSPWTSYLDIMPEKDMTFYAYTGGRGTSEAYYYVEGLDGKDELYYTNVSTGTGYTVTVEEFINIEGFTFDESRSTKVGGKFDGAKFYYTRNSYTLKFFNRTEELSDKTQTVKFEAPLSGYDFKPDYPSDLEPNAYVFAGWYTTAGCYEGSEADLKTMTMPASDMILYAKWTPKTHTVKTYLTKEAMDGGEAAVGTWENVPHGTSAEKPKDPENGKYTFVGWFYMSNDPTPVEKAFDFSMPVNSDLNLYAKWSSNTLMPYTIRYQLADGTEIAPPTEGSALAGSTKTFDAKTGTQLNDGYQSGYFPQTNSHSLTLNIEGGNEFIFIYVPKAEVNYTVRYLEKDTNAVLHEEKHAATRDAVITEKFVQINGYAPDAYQKRLVLSADEEQNVITFWYVKDEVHAPVQIIHWTQNIAGDGYTEYQSSTNLNGMIGDPYNENPLEIPGFTYNTEKSNASGTLTAEGLVLNLYYDRIEYPYEFRFLEQGTENELAAPVTGNARYQAQVTQTAKTIPGYKLVSGASESQAITIAIEDPENVANKNVKIFYYVEDTVDIKYQVVGPANSGTLDSYQDNGVGVIKGTVNGSTPTAAAGFKFVGWYKDADCTQPVDTAWVVNNKLTPQKTKNYGTDEDPVMGYEAATYYAKFEYDVADLTITKSGWDSIDENQSFIFKVSGEGISTQVVIHGNGSVTIKGLKIGTYTVTEVTEWSWRYTPDSKSKSIELKPTEDNVLTFANTREKGKWLSGDCVTDNRFYK